MSHLYKLTEFQGSSGFWYASDIEDLGNGSGAWYLPARMLGITPAAWIKKVIDDFKPDNVFHSDSCDFIGFSWKSQAQMRVYKNWVNKVAREKQFFI